MERLREKFVEYEVDPPDHIWSGIENILNADQDTLRQRLSKFEVEPHEILWTKIQLKLNQTALEPDTTTIPFFRRYRRPLKLTGVAAAITFFAVLTSLLISKKSVSEVPVNPPQKITPVSKKKTSQTDSPSVHHLTPADRH